MSDVIIRIRAVDDQFVDALADLLDGVDHTITVTS